MKKSWMLIMLCEWEPCLLSIIVMELVRRVLSQPAPSCKQGMWLLQSMPAASTVEGLHIRDPTPRTTGIRLIHTGTMCRDIDQAAKYIGAGAATVGVAGSGITN